MRGRLGCLGGQDYFADGLSGLLLRGCERNRIAAGRGELVDDVGVQIFLNRR